MSHNTVATSVFNLSARLILLTFSPCPTTSTPLCVILTGYLYMMKIYLHYYAPWNKYRDHMGRHEKTCKYASTDCGDFFWPFKISVRRVLVALKLSGCQNPWFYICKSALDFAKSLPFLNHQNLQTFYFTQMLLADSFKSFSHMHISLVKNHLLQQSQYFGSWSWKV